jgi:hypothetical protein
LALPRLTAVLRAAGRGAAALRPPALRAAGRAAGLEGDDFRAADGRLAARPAALGFRPADLAAPPALFFRTLETAAVARLTCCFAGVTVLRTVRRTAFPAGAAAATAPAVRSDAADPTDWAVSEAVSTARPAASDALPAARVAADATLWAVSTTAFVAFPMMLPTASADRVSGSAPVLVVESRSSAMVAPVKTNQKPSKLSRG